MRLTKKQQIVYELCQQGLSDKEIAKRLNLGVATIKSHLKAIKQQTDLMNRYAIRKRNLVDIEIAKSILSDRQFECWYLASNGFKRHQIAQQLFISDGTVRVHLRVAMQKIIFYKTQKSVA